MRRIFTSTTLFISLLFANNLSAQSNSSPTTTNVSSGSCATLVADFATTAQGFVSPSPYTAGNTLTLQSGALTEPAGHPNGNRTITLASPGYYYNGGSFTLVGFTISNSSTVRVNVYGSNSSAQGTTFTLVAQSSTSSLTGAVCFRLDDADLSGLAAVRYEVIITTSGSGAVSFDNFQTGAAGAPLPVKFQSLDAKPINNSVSLKWNVATEEGLSGYSIERSADGRNFSQISYVGASGQSDYSFVDSKPTATAYYRIKSVDLNGRYGYSTVALVKSGKSTIVLKAFPSPVIKSVSIQHPTATAGTSISVSSADGRIMKTIVPATGMQQTEIDLSAAKAGLYLVRFNSGNGESETLKILKQ